MANRFDELAKALAGGGPEETGVSRREALRRVGLGLAGAVLGSLGMGTARAAPKGGGGGGSGGNSPCGVYCRRFSTKAERDRCLVDCRACGNPALLCGNSGYNLVCCTSPFTCCAGACVNLGTNTSFCGGCDNNCGSYPQVDTTCVSGECSHVCYEGWQDCDGDLDTGCESHRASDVNNCGACGNVCDGANPYCVNGTCQPCPNTSLTRCPNGCFDLTSDPNNCGECGYVCGGNTPYCASGVCSSCSSVGLTQCGNVCVDQNWDDNNCGGCGVVCDTGNWQVCCWGACVDVCYCYDCGGGGTSF